MSLMDRMRALDDRVAGKNKRPKRKTVQRLGYGFLAVAALFYAGSFWESSLGRGAVVPALAAGCFLGRVQEWDQGRKGLGLRGEGDDDPVPPALDQAARRFPVVATVVLVTMLAVVTGVFSAFVVSKGSERSDEECLAAQRISDLGNQDPIVRDILRECERQ